MQDLFPFGVTHYLLGGLVLGAGIGLIYALTGRIAGISSFLTAAHSWWSPRSSFQSRRAERTWKGVLVAGLGCGALLYTLLLGEPFVTEVQWWRLLVGGVLVGVGTRTALGCTSGHGICGVAALAPSSISATLIFMGVAIVTARLVLAMGVTP